MSKLKGQCLCGDVNFETPSEFHMDVCHCKMCRKWVGGPFVGVDFREGGVTFSKEDGLTWYESSEWAKRGFCKNCGSSLFYRLQDNEDFWAICAGALDLPAGRKIGKEIFIDEKPDYYDLVGDHPRMTGEAFLATLQGEEND